MDFPRSEVLFEKVSPTPLTAQGIFIWLTKLAEFKSASRRQRRGTPAQHPVLVTYSAYESIEHTLHMGFLFLSGFSHQHIRRFADKTRPQLYVRE